MSDSFDVVLTEWYKLELLELPEGDQARVKRKLHDFSGKGWAAAITDQSIRHLREGIHELRILGKGASFRVLCFLVPGRSPRVVVLTTCASKSKMKKRKRFEAEIERAKTRRDLWQEQQKKASER
jgi:phage-related protein